MLTEDELLERAAKLLDIASEALHDRAKNISFQAQTNIQLAAELRIRRTAVSPTKTNFPFPNTQEEKEE